MHNIVISATIPQLTEVGMDVQPWMSMRWPLVIWVDIVTPCDCFSTTMSAQSSQAFSPSTPRCENVWDMLSRCVQHKQPQWPFHSCRLHLSRNGEQSGHLISPCTDFRGDHNSLFVDMVNGLVLYSTFLLWALIWTFFFFFFFYVSAFFAHIHTLTDTSKINLGLVSCPRIFGIYSECVHPCMTTVYPSMLHVSSALLNLWHEELR